MIKILNENIQFSTATRFLGIYLDPELNWKALVNQLKNRIIPRINILKAISGIRWGAHLITLLTIYKGFIRSVLDWGCQVFHPLDEPLYIKVSRLQYAALRTVTGMMQTTPTNVLLDINGEQPLKTRWHFLTAKLLCKIMARTSHPLYFI
ncbi:type-1 retrotransposable element r1dm [Lasius niger]|uniref:Type-1 retrotransposable element r1dm n=1 Tax=Lasius niger TaxID=67767 RepID=A0A0J7JZ54_LASNI|nr:type-1 retrotransposable element r1dm [Lasius niger]